MATITKYIFRENGTVLSEQTYNGRGGSDYQNYGITAPTPTHQGQGFRYEWNLDTINSGGSYIIEDGSQGYVYNYYYDVVHFYDNSNYVTCNFLYADNGQFADVELTNGNTVSKIIGFGAYLKNSIVYAKINPPKGYSLTGEITPSYNGTWSNNTVYRIGVKEGAKITWKDYDGKIIRIDYVKEGLTPTPPTVSRTGYTHTGWSPNIVPVTGDAIYTAQYTINKYHIRFLDDGGIYLDTYLEYGTPLNISMEMTKEDYEFKGWNPNPTYVMQDQDYWAIWEKVRFTIKYFDNGTLLNTVKVNKGENLPSYAPTKEGYRFNVWTPSIQSLVYADATYNATWNTLYIVNFLDTDDSIISSKGYIIGEKIQIPTPPVKPHYTFIKWNPTVNEICNGNATYKAEYGEYSSTIVRFYEGHGNIYNSQTINIQGEYVQQDLSLKELIDIGLVLPNSPTTGGKIFIKWIKNPTRYDEPNKSIIYTFIPKFISTTLEEKYYNTELDSVDNGINEHINNMKLHIVDQNEVIGDSNTTVSGLHDVDDDIIDEINYVKHTNIVNKTSLDAIDSQKIDEQFSTIYNELDKVQDEISEMNVNHWADLQKLGDTINTNESKINSIQNRIYNTPKHVILSESEYKEISKLDKNTIYFTKEIN